MAAFPWHARSRNYVSESEVCKLESVPWDFGDYHPLKPITVTESKTKKMSRKGSTSSTSSSSSSSVMDPLSSVLDGTDPLSLFAAAADPLTTAASVDGMRKKRDKDDSSALGSDFEQWSSKRGEILARYTTTEKLSINLYMGSEKGKGTTSGSAVSEKVRTRLEELDDLEEGSQKELLNLTQQDYMNRIEELNQSLKDAWSSDQKVKALKIVIQFLREKKITTSPAMGTYQFFLILDADIGAPYSDVSLNPGLVPRDQPRDVNGGEWDPASQLASSSEALADRMDEPALRTLPDPRLASRWHPGGPARWNEELKTGKYFPVLEGRKKDLEKAVPGATGSEGHPASPASSRSETPADHTGPERRKFTPRGGYYAWWSSRVPRKPTRKMGKAVPGGTKGTEQETVQKELLQEGSSDAQPVSDRKTQAEQAAGLPGVDLGKITKAAVGKELQKRHIPVVAVVSAALLSVLTLACIPMLWMWKKYLARKRERAAAGQAPPDTDWERDQNGGRGRAELGEAAKEDGLNQRKNVSIPFSWCFEARFAELCSRISTDPSLQPTRRSSSPTDSVSSVDSCSP